MTAVGEHRRVNSNATPEHHRQHYWRRRMTGCSAMCASHRHNECRTCECVCHDAPEQRVLNETSSALPADRQTETNA